MTIDRERAALLRTLQDRMAALTRSRVRAFFQRNPEAIGAVVRSLQSMQEMQEIWPTISRHIDRSRN